MDSLEMLTKENKIRKKYLHVKYVCGPRKQIYVVKCMGRYMRDIQIVNACWENVVACKSYFSDGRRF